MSRREPGLGEYLKQLWLAPGAIAEVHEEEHGGPDFDFKRSFDVRLGVFLKRAFGTQGE